jgi:hypothetical protein
MLKMFPILIIIIYPVTQDARTLLSALLAFSGMSHDLRYNSLQKPTGDRPEVRSKTPLSILSRRQIPNDKKFYWQGTNQKSDPADELSSTCLRRTLSKTEPHSRPPHFQDPLRCTLGK